jgi:hypothetical protein
MAAISYSFNPYLALLLCLTCFVAIFLGNILKAVIAGGSERGVYVAELQAPIACFSLHHVAAGAIGIFGTLSTL